MKRWRVIIELPALHDIAEAHAGISQYDADSADRWFETLYDKIGTLEIFPERCPFAPENKSFKMEIREIFHGRRHTNTAFFLPWLEMKSMFCTFVMEHACRWVRRIPVRTNESDEPREVDGIRSGCYI